MIFASKGFAARLKAAQVKADRAPHATMAIDILNKAIDAEIKLVEAITDMPAFRTWIEGERFDLSKVRAAKK
jgi:hypothetical protein